MGTLIESGHHYYLFGVIPADQTVPVVEHVSLQAVQHQDLVALVEEVPAGEFCSDALEQSMASLDWVARLARKHQSVLELALQHGALVPARLCTVYASVEGVLAALAGTRDRFAELLRRLDGRQEWGLKMRCDEERLAQTLRAPAAGSHPGGPLSGSVAWILAKQAEARLKDAMEDRLEEVIEDLEGVVAGVVVSMRELAPPPESLRDDGLPIVLNLAVLLPAGALQAFDDAVRGLESRYGDEGVSFETTGPWPPYSFCDEEPVPGDLDRLGSCFAQGD